MVSATGAQMMHILCSPEFLYSALRPGVVFLISPDVEARKPIEASGFVNTYVVRRDPNGTIRIGYDPTTLGDWVSLGVKPVAHIYAVDLDKAVVECLWPIEIREVSLSALELAEAQIESLKATLETISRKNNELFTEVYSLRLSVEEALSAQYEMQESFRKRGSQIPWIDKSSALDGGNLELGPGLRTVEQTLAVNPSGFAGFDLHLSWPRVDASVEMMARLFVLDSGAQLGEWTSNLRNKGGWLHFRLDKALADVGYGLSLKLEFRTPDDAAELVRLSLSNVETIYGSDANVDGVAVQGRSLAFRTWKAPLGMHMPRRYNESIFALQKTPTPVAWTIGLNGKLSSVVASEALRRYEETTPNLLMNGPDFVQVHPIPHDVSFVRLPGAFESSIREIVADIGVFHDSGPFVQFGLGIARPDDAALTLNSFDEALLIAFSGWAAADGKSRSSVSVLLPEDKTGVFDLILATRMPKEESTDYAWARFYNLRGVWHPDHSFPVSFTPPAEFEPLKILRDQLCERRIKYRDVAVPLVSLACCIHRPEDLDNVVRQLFRQDYPHVEILVAVNGQRSHEFDCQRIRQLLPNARVWVDEGENLPTVLNHVVNVATGEFFIKIDADDIYGDQFISDLVREALITQAEIVGKSCFGVLFEDEKTISLHRSHPFHQYVSQIAGGTMCIRMDCLREIKFDEGHNSGSDYKLQLDFAAAGHRIWSSDPFNYLHIRNADQERHTWKGGPRDYKRWPNYRSYGLEDRWLFFV